VEILVEISPLNPGTGSRVLLRAASADDKRILAANGNRWWPAITRKPSLTHDWFDGDFTGTINTGSASFDLAMFGLKRQDAAVASYHWAAAPVTLYEIDPAVGTATVIFSGVVETFGLENEQLKIGAKVDTTAFELNAMVQVYLGTGGIEGPIDLQNKVKPWCFGNPQGLEPILIDAINNVYQVNGYGPINGVTVLYERAASFGASFGDFATYTALVAAAIPAGRWGTCLAYGLIRLGAPAYGVITADVQGDAPGGTWLRKTGEIINRIATGASVPGAKIDSTSLAALDVAVPRNISIYLTEQAKIIDIIQRLARPCNASAGISWLGKLFVVRTVIGTPGTTLDAQGRRRPPVLTCAEESVSSPYWRVEMAGVRCWRVHTPAEIAFYSQLVDLGGYSAISSYREGNIVTDQAARWVYVNPTATTGNAPPTLPATSNSYWTILSQPPNSFQIAYANGISLEGLKPAAGGVEPGDGLIPNALMANDASGWTFPVWAARTAALSSAPAAFAIRTTTGTTGSGSVFMPAASVTGGQTIYLGATGISSGTGGRSATMSVVEYNSAGALLLTTPFSIAPATVDVQQRFDFSLILNAATAKAIIKVDIPTFTGGALEITAVRCSYTQPGAAVTAAIIGALGDNLVANSMLVPATASWTLDAGIAWTVGLSSDPGNYLQFQPGAVRNAHINGGALIPLNGAAKLFWSNVDFNYFVTSGTFSLIFEWFLANGATASTASTTVSVLPAGTSVWTAATYETVPPADAVFFTVKYQSNFTGGVVNCAALRIARVANGADVTAAAVALLTMPAPPVIKADYTGAVLSGQLTRTAKATRTRGGVDVSSTTTWSIAATGCTASIDTTGLVSITAIASTGKIVVTSVRDGATLVDEFTVLKENGAPPASGGTGASSASDSSIASISAATYGGSQAGTLTVTAGAAGTVNLSAPLDFSVGSGAGIAARGKWLWRIVGGSFADVAAEINSSVTAVTNEPNSGYIEVTQTKTGLTPSSTYEFYLQLRRSSGTGTVDFSGTAAAVAS
jgi:hypothetical protein